MRIFKNKWFAKFARDEERAFKALADITLSLSDIELETLIKQGTFKPVKCHE